MNKILITILMMVLLSFSVTAAFERSQDELYEYSFWDTANRNLIPASKFAEFTTTDAPDINCMAPNFDLQYQPKIIEVGAERFALIQGTDSGVSVFQIFSNDCEIVGDSSAHTGNAHSAETLVYELDTDVWTILYPMTNLSVKRFSFNGTDMTDIQDFTIGNLTNSLGSCQDMDSSNNVECLWQNVTNDIEGINIEANTTVSHDVMQGTVYDTALRKPAIGNPISSERIFVLGKYNTTSLRACSLNPAISSLADEWNLGSCLEMAAADVDYVPPIIFNVDASGNSEYIMAWTNSDGVRIQAWTPYAQSKYVHLNGDSSKVPISTMWTQLSDNNIVPAVCLIKDIGTTSFETVECVTRYWQSTSSAIQIPDITHAMQTLAGDFIASDAGEEVIFHRGMLSLSFDNVSFSGVSLEPFGFVDPDGHFAVGDMDDNGYLDIVYENSSNTYFSVTTDLNDPPEWTANADLFTLVAENTLLCVNDTYGIISSTSYTDNNSDQVRLVVDCYGDSSQIAYSIYGSGGSPTELTAQCVFNVTGTHTMRVRIEDDRGTSSTNASLAFSVTTDTDICAAPSTVGDITGGTIGTSVTTDTPEEDIDDVFSPFGLTGSWITIVWIFLMLMISFAVFQNVQGSAMFPAVAIVNVLMLVMGWIFGAIGTIVMVMVAILVAGFVVITLFRGGSE